MGKVVDSNERTIGWVVGAGNNGLIQDAGERTVGWVVMAGGNGMIENAAERTVGWVIRAGNKGMIQNAAEMTVGWIDSNGMIEDAGERTIGCADPSDGILLMGGAAFLLLLLPRGIEKKESPRPKRQLRQLSKDSIFVWAKRPLHEDYVLMEIDYYNPDGLGDRLVIVPVYSLTEAYVVAREYWDKWIRPDEMERVLEYVKMRKTSK